MSDKPEIAPCPNCGMPVRLVPDGVECTGRVCGYQVLLGASLSSGQASAVAAHNRIATAVPVERLRAVLVNRPVEQIYQGYQTPEHQGAIAEIKAIRRDIAHELGITLEQSDG